MSSADQLAPAAAAATAFRSVFAASREEGIAFAPGRVNLVGEHTDYNDGFVLPMAISEGIDAAYTSNDEDVLRVHASDTGETREAPLADIRAARVQPSGWFRYVAGMAAVMSEAGLELRGTTMALAANLPAGAGLSSSAALELVAGRALSAAAGGPWEPRAASIIAQQAEQRFAGVACGIMDQMAVACAREGRALLLDCRSLETSDVEIPAQVSVVILNSGVRRSLASSAYNDRRAACERAVAAIRRFAPQVSALRDVDEKMLEQARGSLDEQTYRRAAHVVAEIARPASLAAELRSGDLEAAGRVMLDSHASLRDLYEVSCLELDTLVWLSMGQKGCYGARLTGAGFGGCAVALVDTERVEAFSGAVARSYQERTGLQAQVIVSRPAAGARLLTRLR